MQERLKVGCTAGFLGALILIALMAIMQLIAGMMPAFVTVYEGVFGPAGAAAWIIGAILFAISGAIWGMIYTALVSDPNVGNGMAFGILPTLWQWIVVALIVGQPLFYGFTAQAIILPIIANILIWGSFVGWYSDERLPDVQTRPATG